VIDIFVRPRISSCSPEHNLVSDGSFTPINLTLNGWGWVAVRVVGEYPQYMHRLKFLFWPLLNGIANITTWKGFSCFISNNNSTISFISPANKTIKVKFKSLLGWSYYEFRVPSRSHDQRITKPGVPDASGICVPTGTVRAEVRQITPDLRVVSAAGVKPIALNSSIVKNHFRPFIHGIRYDIKKDQLLNNDES
jgi:hypothetical protein